MEGKLFFAFEETAVISVNGNQTWVNLCFLAGLLFILEPTIISDPPRADVQGWVSVEVSMLACKY